ncbi:MAG: T9SS type A sorting domain-containing protein [Chitinophagales bacterium]
MKRFLLVGILTWLHIHTYAQFSAYCTESRFGDDLTFAAGDIITEYNIPYGLADNWYGNVVNYKWNTFDIAYPDLAVDELQRRPLIVLFHGGGFGGGDKDDLDAYIFELAQRGYVAASCNYRLGWETGGADPSDCLGDPASLLDAWYRCSQDVDAAIRYLTSEANMYGIDTAWIFAGGQSAGVMGVTTAICVPQTVLDQQYTIQSEKLGPLAGADNPIDEKYTIKGIVNMWGAILDTIYLTQEKNIPFISFYGDADRLISPQSGPVHGCTEPNQYFTVFGSAAITNRLEHVQTCTILHENKMGSHEAYADAFTIPNTACFVKSILCSDCISGHYINDVGSCRDSYTSGLDIPVGDLLIYPDPADQFIRVELPAWRDHAGMHITVYDVSGKTLYSLVQGNMDPVFIPVADLPNGIYILECNTNSQVYTGKCLVQHH